MNKHKALMMIVAPVLCCLIVGLVVGAVLVRVHAQHQYAMVSGLTDQMLGQYPETERDYMAALKESLTGRGQEPGGGVLAKYGYTPGTFADLYIREALPAAMITALLFLALLFVSAALYRRNNRRRIAHLIAYLAKANAGNDMPVLTDMEDDFAPLEDELYKTVTQLRETREEAVRERQRLADTLADISHQIKTPVSTISLSAQLLEANHDPALAARIRAQSEHLDSLVEALLTLSRIDAGVLRLNRRPVDVYTMLQISVDALDGIIAEKRIRVSLPQHPVSYEGDIEWSMEAFINIIKNCAEHTCEGGCITIEYGQNPLYTEIRIRDGGPGIPARDLPHIFTRFYRGDTARRGIGVGLSLAKSIIELQNGTVSAANIPGGGACFTVHFYCH